MQCEGITRHRIPVAERLARATNKAPGQGPQGECWQCTMAPNTHGYPTIRVPRTDGAWSTANAHHAAWEAVHGPINDPDVCVCHTCDNRLCVRVSHLFLGSRADNNADRDAKGRTAKGDRSGRRKHPEAWANAKLGPKNPPRGEECHLAKLTAAEVREIRSLRTQGWTYARLAARFSTVRANIGNIVTRRTWRHVP